MLLFKIQNTFPSFNRRGVTRFNRRLSIWQMYLFKGIFIALKVLLKHGLVA